MDKSFDSFDCIKSITLNFDELQKCILVKEVNSFFFSGQNISESPLVQRLRGKTPRKDLSRGRQLLMSFQQTCLPYNFFSENARLKNYKIVSFMFVLQKFPVWCLSCFFGQHKVKSFDGQIDLQEFGPFTGFLDCLFLLNVLYFCLQRLEVRPCKLLAFQPW